MEVFTFEQRLWTPVCFNNHMAAKAHNSGMWIRLTASPRRDGHHEGYGEGQSTRNSRFLELADVILSGPTAAKEKSRRESRRFFERWYSPQGLAPGPG